MDKETSITRILAPEDIRKGMYVAVLREVLELIPWMCDDPALRSTEPVRLSYIPCESGEPLEVIGVDLPFVLARRPNRDHETLDVRRHQLVRLSERYGRATSGRLREDARRRRKRERKG